MSTKQQRREWWANLRPAEQQAYIEKVQRRKAQKPNAEAREASARLDLATEIGCFMREVPAAQAGQPALGGSAVAGFPSHAGSDSATVRSRPPKGSQILRCGGSGSLARCSSAAWYSRVT